MSLLQASSLNLGIALEDMSFGRSSPLPCGLFFHGLSLLSFELIENRRQLIFSGLAGHKNQRTKIHLFIEPLKSDIGERISSPEQG